MELGGLAEFRFVPACKGNRDRPEAEQADLMVRRLTAVDVLQDPTTEQLHEWRDEAFRRWAVTEQDKSGERVVGFEKIAAGLEMVPPEMLTIFRRVITHTHGYRNFTLEGRQLTEPAEIFLLARIPDSLDQADNLLLEVYNALRTSASLTDDELGNWLKPSDGGSTPTSTNETDAAEGASQQSASTEEEQTAS